MNDLKLKYSFVLFLLLLSASAGSQELHLNENKIKLKDASLEVSRLNNDVMTSPEHEKRKSNFDFSGFEGIDFQRYINKKVSYDFMSDIGSNFNFGSIIEDKVYVNFSPKLNIQPFSFISVYANHNFLKVIPLSEINDYAYSAVMQSLALAGTDLTLKFIFKEDNLITRIVSFAAENIVLSFIIKPAAKPENKKILPWINDESYYYSVSFKF